MSAHPSLTVHRKLTLEGRGIFPGSVTTDRELLLITNESFTQYPVRNLKKTVNLSKQKKKNNKNEERKGLRG